MTIGERIKSRRIQLGMSQADLASKIGTGQKQVSRYETGENLPSAAIFIAIALALRVSLDYLAGLDSSSSEGNYHAT